MAAFRTKIFLLLLLLLPFSTRESRGMTDNNKYSIHSVRNAYSSAPRLVAIVIAFQRYFGIISHFFNEFYSVFPPSKLGIYYDVALCILTFLSLIRILSICCSCGNNFFLSSSSHLRWNIEKKAESDEQIDVCQFSDCIVMLMWLKS